MSVKIIVPTDFSENALKAALYACQIAKNCNYSLHLLHCYNSETSIFDEKINSKEPTSPIFRGDFLMAELKDSLQQKYPSLKIVTECKEGLISEVLPKATSNSNYALIVMGSNGLEEKDSPMFGSLTSQVARKSYIPVIAVPNHDIRKSINKIGLLTNFKEDELESLIEFKKHFNGFSEVDLIHVYPNSIEIQDVLAKMDSWCKKIKEIAEKATINKILKPINYNDQNSDTIAEIVNNTINEIKYDLVIVTKTRKSFFERWFSRSISKEIILKLETVIFFDNN